MQYKLIIFDMDGTILDTLEDLTDSLNFALKKSGMPDAIYAGLEHFGLEKKDALYIGDSEVDIQTAANAGMDCICVGWGFRKKEFLLRSGATVVLSKPVEILEYIED